MLCSRPDDGVGQSHLFAASDIDSTFRDTGIYRIDLEPPQEFPNLGLFIALRSAHQNFHPGYEANMHSLERVDLTLRLVGPVQIIDENVRIEDCIHLFHSSRRVSS